MSPSENLVEGLLGPEEPEVGCDECFAELDRYVELELTGADPDAQLPDSGPTSPAAWPAARSTRACATCGPATTADRVVERPRTGVSGHGELGRYCVRHDTPAPEPGAPSCPSPPPTCTTRCSTGPRSAGSPTRPST